MLTTAVGALTGADRSATADVVRLRTDGGRALLGTPGEDVDVAPEELDLPPTMVQALSEWAGVADSVVRGGNGSAGARDMVSRRGRQLAARLAAETGVAVDYRDPITGHVHRVRGEHGVRPTATLGRGAAPRVSDGAAEETPWATGLTVSAIIGAIVAICLVVVSVGLARVSPLLATAVNLAVAAGFAPSIWLGRRVPVWRWVALGTAAGIGLAWFALLLGLLG